MRKIFLSILSLCFAVGCSKESPTTTPAAPTVPKRLVFSRPAVGEKLTKFQVEEIKSTFATKSMMILPPGELIFPPKEMTQQEREWREADLARVDRNSYDLLKEIQYDCVKGRPTFNVDATFPMNGDTSIENLRVNDKLNYSASGSIFGAQCPVDVSLDGGFGARVDQVDQNNKSATFLAHSTSKSKALMINPKYAKLLQARGIVVDSILSGVGIKQEANENVVVNYNLSGSYYALDAEIPYRADAQFLSRKDKSVHIQEVIISTVLTFSKYTVRVDYHSFGNMKTRLNIEEEIYVNGHLLSRQEFDDLFGEKNPAGNVSGTSIFSSLN